MTSAPLNSVPPRRFQFSLASMLACTLGCALAAGLARQFWTSEIVPAWFRLGMAAFVGGLVVYATLRLPYLWRHLWADWQHYRALRSHREQLNQWAKAHRQDAKRIMEETDK